MEVIEINNQKFDIIQIFDFSVLVQNIATKEISVIEFSDIITNSSDATEASNIISIKGWRQWLRKKDQKKQNLKQSSLRNKAKMRQLAK